MGWLSRGEPISNALVEIWQVDNNGAYLHNRTTNKENRDTNFQGFGRFLTGSSGEYLFRTLKPVPYPGRTPSYSLCGEVERSRQIHYAMLHQRKC